MHSSLVPLALLALFPRAIARKTSLRLPRENVDKELFRRALQTITEEDCYHECVERQMTAVECSDYIKSVLGEDLSASKYPDLEIKIALPRSAAAKAATYWEVAIPTNLYGEVSCDIKGGVISYRDPWITEAGERQIPDTECFGLNAAECCNRMKTNVQQAGISLTDINGNCLSCWVHQQVLTPIVAEGSGELQYVIHGKKSGAATCASTTLTPEEVQKVDEEVETTLAEVSTDIDRVLENGASCDELRLLQNELMVHARSFVRAMVAISELLCGKCDPADTIYDTIPDDMRTSLVEIQGVIRGDINSDENRIVIYADHSNKVMEPPKVGGSMAEFDYDRNDPDCDDVPAETAADLAIGNDDPSNRANGGDVPVDDGYCSATDLVNSSQGFGDACFKCRRCLLSRCQQWGEERECRKIMKFEIPASPEQWEWCLELNGGLVQDQMAHSDGTYQHWCACGRQCKDECVREGFHGNPA